MGTASATKAGRALSEEFWFNVVSTVGVPTAFLFGLLFMGWKIWKALEPHIIETIKAHTKLVDELRETTRANTEALAKFKCHAPTQG